MKTILILLLATLEDLLRSRALLQLEMLTLHQQLAMVVNATPKARLFAAVPILSVFYQNCKIFKLNLWALWSISTRVW